MTLRLLCNLALWVIIQNLVFVEILRRGHELNKDVFFYKTRNNKEVDFLLKKGIKVEQLMQV
jgi:predicted AAA+ superfamily ATPase